MKKVALLFVLASAFSINAHATKARVASMLGAAHLVDSQSIFDYPSEVNFLGQYMTLEMGPTADGMTEPKAEGGLFRKSGDGVIGFYLGHHDVRQATARTALTFQNQTNPIQVFYAKGNWGATVGLSNTDKKTTSVKETTLFAGFGQTLSNMTWGVNAEVLATAENAAGDKFTGAPIVALKARSNGDVYYHGGLSYGALKNDKAVGADVEVKDLGAEVGVVDRSFKTTERDLYYGVSLKYADADNDGKHKKMYTLPVSIGFEQPLNSWATARGSVQQNLLLGSVKDETAATAALQSEDTIANNTVVSGGLGFKYGALSMDGVLSAASSGDVNGTAFLAKAGLIYAF